MISGSNSGQLAAISDSDQQRTTTTTSTANFPSTASTIYSTAASGSPAFATSTAVVGQAASQVTCC